MASFGSSVINKSGKRVAPKAPPRRRILGQQPQDPLDASSPHRPSSAQPDGAHDENGREPTPAVARSQARESSTQPSQTLPAVKEHVFPSPALQSVSGNRPANVDVANPRERSVSSTFEERGTTTTSVQPVLTRSTLSGTTGGIPLVRSTATTTLPPSGSAIPQVVSTSPVSTRRTRGRGLNLSKHTQEAHPVLTPGVSIPGLSEPSEGPQIVLYEVPSDAPWNQTDNTRTSGRLEASTAANGAGSAQQKKGRGRGKKFKEQIIAESTAQSPGEQEAPASKGKVSARVANSLRRKRKTKAFTDPAQPVGEDDAEEQPRRKRRPRKRAETPDDERTATTIPSMVTMYDLATRNRRSGQKSEREKLMDQIDWAAVKERRKEEELRMAATRWRRVPAFPEHESEDGDGGELGEVDLDEQLNRAVQSNRARQQTLRIRIVNGEHVIDEQSQFVDRHAIATQEEVLEDVEEDDLTQRFNSHTYVNMRRRDPEERIPNRDKWGPSQTDRFYECLSQFGTDFMILSKMFPGRTRRHLRQKYRREERVNPARIKAALDGETRGSWNLETFRAKAGLDESDFKDPSAVEEELRVRREEREKEIEETRLEMLETRRQRRLAGDLSDEEGAAQGGAEGRTTNKDTTKEKSKKKKGKNAGTDPGAGNEEVVVEMLSEIDD